MPVRDYPAPHSNETPAWATTMTRTRYPNNLRPDGGFRISDFGFRIEFPCPLPQFEIRHSPFEIAPKPLPPSPLCTCCLPHHTRRGCAGPTRVGGRCTSP